MNKNIKDIVVLSLLAFGIFLLPTVINYGFVDKKTDVFFERVDEDFNECVKSANDEPRDINVCKEIRRSAELAFNSAKSVSDRFSNTSILETVVFILAIIILNLRRRIKELETK